MSFHASDLIFELLTNIPPCRPHAPITRHCTNIFPGTFPRGSFLAAPLDSASYVLHRLTTTFWRVESPEQDAVKVLWRPALVVVSLLAFPALFCSVILPSSCSWPRSPPRVSRCQPVVCISFCLFGFIASVCLILAIAFSCLAQPRWFVSP